MTHQSEDMEQVPIQFMQSMTNCAEMVSPQLEFTVPTIFKKAPKQVNLVELGLCELFSLKEDDPFLYYSIPAMRIAAMHGIDVDECAYDTTTSSCNSSGLLRRSISVELSESHDHTVMEIDEANSDSDINDEVTLSLCSEVNVSGIEFIEVTRQSRISFESFNPMLSDYLYAVDSLTVSESQDQQNDEDDWLFSCTNLSFDE